MPEYKELIMPELPEVETICNGLKPTMEGRQITRVELRRENLRYPFPADFVRTLEKKEISLVRRRAKYLLIELSDGKCVIIHLGMSGKVKICTEDANDPLDLHDHVIMNLKGGTTIIYNDPRRFGFMDVYDPSEGQPPYIARLGVEPLGNEFNAEYVAKKWVGKRTTLKAALLDQRIIAGLGNIYVLEALYRSGLSPFKMAGELVKCNGRPEMKLEELVVSIKEVLKSAIIAGGSTLKDYHRSDGSLGYFQHHFQVYGREGEPCFGKNCASRIKRKLQNGRSTFYCGECQK